MAVSGDSAVLVRSQKKGNNLGAGRPRKKGRPREGAKILSNFVNTAHHCSRHNLRVTRTPPLILPGASFQLLPFHLLYCSCISSSRLVLRLQNASKNAPFAGSSATPSKSFFRARISQIILNTNGPHFYIQQLLIF